ncbi:Nuclear factor of activated T-cells 5 [Halotydeus destructor]|nr:Nuclear factor of activated T-cells 5 [Halotydeus destructor]
MSSFLPLDEDATLFDIADFAVPSSMQGPTQFTTMTPLDIQDLEDTILSESNLSMVSPPVQHVSFNPMSDQLIAAMEDSVSNSMMSFASSAPTNRFGRQLSRTISEIEDDSGFSHDELTPSPAKVAKASADDGLTKLLRDIMKANERNQDFEESTNFSVHNELRSSCVAKFSKNYPSKSTDGRYELKIINQPEEQHRARYLTEGSRGSIKDKSGLGHPVVKLEGPVTKNALKVHCFIGHDKQLGVPHLFYQASKISGKNSTRCTTDSVDGVTMVIVELEPENDMQVTIDCIGILKERNVDVEQKILQLTNKTSKDDLPPLPNKKRSTKCRLVFRVELPSGEILQTVSNAIVCTQPVGVPEIQKKSLCQDSVVGGSELFIVGKNFLKDSKIVWKASNWTKVVEPDKEHFNATHLICTVPTYDGPETDKAKVETTLAVRSGGKYSAPHSFVFVNEGKQQESAAVASLLMAQEVPSTPSPDGQSFATLLLSSDVSEQNSPGAQSPDGQAMATALFFPSSQTIVDPTPARGNLDGSSFLASLFATPDQGSPIEKKPAKATNNVTSIVTKLLSSNTPASVEKENSFPLKTMAEASLNDLVFTAEECVYNTVDQPSEGLLLTDQWLQPKWLAD